MQKLHDETHLVRKLADTSPPEFLDNPALLRSVIVR